MEFTGQTIRGGRLHKDGCLLRTIWYYTGWRSGHHLDNCVIQCSYGYMYMILIQPPSSRLIEDNFDALASRVHAWTATDARRFLHVAGHHGSRRRRRPRTERDFLDAVMDLSPSVLYRAIMTSPARGGLGSNYEVGGALHLSVCKRSHTCTCSGLCLASCL